MLTKFIISPVLILAAMQLLAQDPSTAIQFAERVYNFGTIKEQNGKVSHTFVFENKGKTPVVIDDIHSSCGCIGKVVSNDPVKPGAKGKVTITFDPGYKSGFFSKEIVVLSNKLQQYNRIWVEGVIVPMDHPVEESYPYNFGNGLYLRLKVMAFGYLKPGETKQMELHYANSTGQEMNLSFIANGHKEGLRFTNPGKIPPKARGVIKISYTLPAVAGEEKLLRLHPYVNNKKLRETLDIRVLNASLGKGKGK
jgi:hypothetical protein